MPTPSRRIANKDMYAVIPFFMAEIGLMLIATIIVSYGWPSTDGSIGIATTLPYFYKADSGILPDTIRVPSRRILHVYLSEKKETYIDGLFASQLSLDTALRNHLRQIRQTGHPHYLILKTDVTTTYAHYLNTYDAYRRTLQEELTRLNHHEAAAELRTGNPAQAFALLPFPLIEWEANGYYGPVYRWVR